MQRLPANKISSQPLNLVQCINNIFNILNINLTPGFPFEATKSISIIQINSSLKHSLSSKFVTWFLSPGFLIVKFLMSNFWSIPLGRPTDSFDCKLKLFTGSTIANPQWQSKTWPIKYGQNIWLPPGGEAIVRRDAIIGFEMLTNTVYNSDKYN